MSDQEITCSECGAVFIFTEGEQEFYAEKQLTPPKRCQECRDKRKAQSGGSRGKPQLHDAVCVDCGVDCQVPFKPMEGKPVYCRECFKAQKHD